MTPASFEMLGNFRNQANLQWYVVAIITRLLSVPYATARGWV